MKKSVFLILASTLLTTPAAQAGEEARPQPLAENILSGQAPRIDIPMAFSVSPGRWSQAEPGPLYTSGAQSADFILPSLGEEPAPIRYPRWAVREGREGNFVIAVEVLPTGEVGRWKITESTGYPLLDEVATKAVTGWHFHPATEMGKAVVSCIQIPIRFELKES